jgi:hypothetical protein
MGEMGEIGSVPALRDATVKRVKLLFDGTAEDGCPRKSASLP